MTIHTPIMSVQPLPPITRLDGRYDLYGPIHKALRRAHCEMLMRLGSADFDRPGISKVLTDLRDLLALGAAHIGHEETHIHSVLNERLTKASQDIELEHSSHRLDFEQLVGMIDRLEHTEASGRVELGRQLYLTYSLFVARDFEHMCEEETAFSERLWEAFSDADLAAMEGSIKSSIAPDKMIALMRLMIPGVSRDQRFDIMLDIKTHAPKPAFEAVLDLAARPTLSADEMSELERRLCLIQCVPAI